MTEWRAVVGYEGLYEISDTGLVRGMNRVVGPGRSWPGKMIALDVLVKAGGYRQVRVRLSRDGQRKKYIVGGLVLSAFVGPRPTGMECCHRDSDPTNNHVANLRWGTHISNVRDTIARGRHNTANAVPRETCASGHELPPLLIGYRRYCLQCQPGALSRIA